MQNIQLSRWKFEKIAVDPRDFVLPEEEQYFFETGIRRSIKVTPIWTTWETAKGLPEKIYEYKFTFVYSSWEDKIELKNISVTSLNDLYNGKPEGLGSVIRQWIDGDLNIRTKEQFNADLQSVLRKINS